MTLPELGLIIRLAIGLGLIEFVPAWFSARERVGSMGGPSEGLLPILRTIIPLLAIGMGLGLVMGLSPP